MPEIVISDTSCLILLQKIGQLQLLSKIYPQVFVTSMIAKEFGSELPKEILVRDPNDAILFKTLSQFVDAGEASAFTLAFEIENSVLILDDRKARKFAGTLGLKFTGTLGVLVKAKQLGKVPSLRLILEKLQETDFRISQEIINKILMEAGEI
jgi:predicted nucleic acid-binding protein